MRPPSGLSVEERFAHLLDEVVRQGVGVADDLFHFLAGGRTDGTLHLVDPAHELRLLHRALEPDAAAPDALADLDAGRVRAEEFYSS